MTTLKRSILEAALFLAQSQNYTTVTRAQIARYAMVANGTVSYHFLSMDKLYDDVIDAAIEREIVPVVAYGLLDPIRRRRILFRATPALLREAGQYLSAPRS